MPYRRIAVWQWLALLAIVAAAGYGFVVTGAGALAPCDPDRKAYLGSVDRMDASPDLAFTLSNRLPQRLCVMTHEGRSLWITDCHEEPRLSVELEREPLP